MTASNHTLAAAALTTVAPVSPLLFIAAFLSHFVLDSVPHFGMPGVKVNSWKFNAMLIVDGVFMLGAVVLTLCNVQAPTFALLCAIFLSISPDFLHITHWLGKKPILPSFQNFHSKIQRYEKVPGIVVEIIFAIAMISIIL